MKKRLPFLGLSSFLITLSLLLGPNLLASDSKTKNLQLEAERTILQKLSLNDGVFYGNFGMIQNGNFNLMSPVTVEYTAEDLDYCIPTISFTVEPMTRVVFAGIDNPSSATSTDAYEDFTAIEGEVTQGETYPIALEGYTGGSYTNRFTVWIDWNQDGTFESSEMTEVGSIYGSTGTDGQQATSDIIVPVDATLGTTRMRVIKNYSTSPTNPCGTYSYGQIEDYTINVNPMPDCDGAPDAGAATTNPSIGQIGNDYTVSASDFTLATGLSFQWQSNTNGAGWVNEGDALELYSDYTATAVGAVGDEIDWRLAVTCIDSGETSYSEIANFTISLYCIPEATNASRHINNFSTTGGVNNVSNLESGFSAGGYGNFTDTHLISQVQGESVDFSATIIGGTAGFRIWVDWNQDGEFDATEEVAYSSSGFLATHTGSFDVPTDALLGETRMRIVSHWGSTTGDTSPCATGFNSGEFEDYTFEVLPMDDCSGTPDAGTAAVTPTEANPGVEYTVSADGYTIAAGLSFQWQSNTDGAGWVNEGEATEIYGDFTATAPLEVGTEVEWKLLVTCIDSEETTESTTATFTTVLEYCTPTYGTYSSGDYLNAVSTEGAVEDISYTNSVGGVHSDQTSLIIKTYPGQVFDLNTAYTGGGQTIGAWVDWNENGTFGVDNPDERIALSNGSSPQSFVVTIPEDIEPGDYIFRVRGSWSNHVADGDNFACNYKSYGSSIDVTLRVEALDDCTGTPTGGEVTVNPIEGVAGSTYTVSATDFSIGSGMTYQWQSNTNGAGWVDEGDVMSNYENFTAVATGEPEDTIEWRLLVTCTHSGETSESTTASFTIALYCIPEGINPGRYINNFSTTGATQNISNMETGFSTGGYANFTDTHTVEQAAGEDVEFEVDIVGGTAGFRIWVDWNQDGEFDTTEEVAWQSDSFENTQSGSFTVPADALEGETRMRIVSHWSSNTGNVDPCATGFNSGEFEDYKFIVTENDGGTDPEPTEYCEPELDCTDGDMITNVTFQEISNDTTCSPDGYGDYTDMVASVDAGSTYPISVTVGDGWLYESVSVWIDFDNSGTFDENEFYFIGTGSDEVLTGDIAIPADVEEGNYRMRVRVAAVGSDSSTWDMSCDETQAYGETEDYTVQVSNDGTTEPGDEYDCAVEYAGSHENGLGNLQTLLYANDFVVANGVTMSVESLTVDIFADYTDASTLTIYEDNAGQPGAVIQSFSNVAPTSKELVGEAFGFNIYESVFEFPTAVELEAGTYWIGLQVSTGSEGTSSFWATSDTFHGALPYYSNDGGASWTQSTLGGDCAFIISGTCTGEAEPVDGCLWTVTVSDNNFGDEVEWEFRDQTTGNILLAGGGYGLGYNDSRTVVAEGPVEFYISTVGLFNDNTPSYSIQNENGVILSGVAPGGTTQTFSDMTCDDLPPPPPNLTCEENFVASNNLENGIFLGGDTNQRLAVDVIVGDEGFTVFGMDLNIFTDGNTDLEFYFTIYEDDGGLPGAVFNNNGFGNVHSNEYIGNAFGYDVYNYVVQFETPVTLDANSTYWIEVESTGIAWEATGINTLGSGLAFLNDNVSDWTDGGPDDLVYSLVCHDLGVSDLSSFDFAYYPNPVRDVLNIASQKAVQSVEVYNLTGQRVMSESMVNQSQIDVSKLTTGTYVFRVTLEDGQVETFKIIKKGN